MDSWLGKLGVPLPLNLIIINSATLSQSPRGRSLKVEYHFFYDPSPRNDQRPGENLLAQIKTKLVWDLHSCSLSWDSHEMSLNINMKMIRPVNFSGVTLNLDSNSWTLWHSCVVYPGMYSIQIPHGPRLYVCQAPNAFICVSSVAPPKHQMRLYVCHQMRLHVCHQMRFYVCHQMRLYVCHQMRLYVCHQMRLYVCVESTTEFASLAYLLLASLARFFNSLN